MPRRDREVNHANVHAMGPLGGGEAIEAPCLHPAPHMRALGVRKRLPLDLDQPDYITTDPDTLEPLVAVAGGRGRGDEELGVHDRPTIPIPPAPFESGVRLGPKATALIAVTVDVVAADLTRDPRSESWVSPPEAADRAEEEGAITPRVAAFSLVRALRGC